MPALLATSVEEERAWTMEQKGGGKPSGGATLRNVFVNIHPTHEARAARVAVNPATLILMRLRHVQHTSAPYSAGSVLHLAESTGVQRSLRQQTYRESEALRNICVSFYRLPIIPPCVLWPPLFVENKRLFSVYAQFVNFMGSPWMVKFSQNSRLELSISN